MNIHRAGLVVSSASLCTLSLTASVLLWISLPVTWWGMAMAGTGALGLELAKFIFIPVGIAIYRTRRILGLVTSLLGWLLFLVSVMASVAFLELVTDKREAVSIQSSGQFQSSQRRLRDIDSRIEALTRLASAEVAEDYRGRSYGAFDRLAAAESERALVLREIQTIKPEGTQSSLQALLSLLADVFGLDGDVLRWLTFVLLSLLVDLGAVVSLLLLGVLGCNRDATMEKHPVSVLQEPVTDGNLKGKNIASGPFSADQSVSLKQIPDSIEARVLAGEFGDSPGVRQVMRELGVSYQKVKQAFDKLIEQGLLDRNGKVFRLV